jgi:hypothetical protein
MTGVKQQLKIGAGLSAGFAVGDVMEDGTILAGYYEGKPFYTTPADAPGIYTFDEAASYARNLDANGHRDWRVPKKEELDVLFMRRAAIGGFDESGLSPAGWYWSSLQATDYYSGWAQCFSDGFQNDYGRNDASSLRVVR